MESLAAVLCLLEALMAPRASARHLHISPNISPTTTATRMALATLVALATMAPLASAQLRPPNLSPDNLPDTAFTCEDKVTGGYYADMEADCQLFHVCVQVSEYEFQDFHFLCPNDTVFDQQHLVCTNWFEVDCHAQLAFFSNDFGIKRSGGGGGGVGEDEDARQGSHSSERDQGLGFGGQSGIVSRNRNTGRGQLEVGRRRPVQHRSHSQRRFPVRPSSDYEDTDNSEVLEEAPRAAEPPPRDPARIAAITGSTPLPQFFTTTARPSRAISSSGLLSGRNLRTTTTTTTTAPAFPEPRETQEPAGPKTIQPFVNFGRDGRKPHVKSNIRAKLANSGSGSRKKFFSKLNQQKIRKKAGHKVALGNRGRKEIKFVAPAEDKPTRQTFSGPEVRPDGRAPRVKANLRREDPREEVREELRGEVREEEPEERTLAPFVEQFFASPSSPKPFIFTGSPEPRLRGADTLLTSAPEESFLPTVQPDSTFGPATDLLPPESREQGSSFLARPPSSVKQQQRSRFRGRNRVVVKSTVPSFAIVEEEPASDLFSSEEPNSLASVPTRPTKSKPRVKSNLRSRGKFGKSSSSALNSVTSEVDCSNPFLCPPKSTAAGRRPRVKSNVRAKKRNFWHGAGSTGPVGGRRKIRRGRKILRKPDNIQFSNEISNEIEAHTVAAPVEEETEQFIPTVRTFATTTPRPSTRRTTPQPVDDFEDFFDSENDLFVASSTVSSVVFKGSPTPGGWASSPAPNFDGSGVQVSFSSPSPYGFGPSGRPSFNNIGAHVDLGPKKKILAPEQLFFISSTMSNKIFIGDPEEDTVTEPTVVVDDTKKKEEEEEDKSSSRFSSFPIRGLNTLAGPKGSSSGLLPFRPRKSPFLHFGRNHKKAKKEEDKTEAPAAAAVHLEEEEGEESEAGTTVTEKPEETSTRVFKPVTRKGPRVKSNLLFNRRKPGGISSGRNKFAGKIPGILSTPAAETTSTTESVTDKREEEDVATTTVATLEEEAEGEKRPNIASRFKSSNRRPFGGVRPGHGFPRPPISFTNALLAKRKLRGGKKEEVATEEQEEEEVEDEVTTVAPPSTSTVFTAFGSSSSSSSSSSALSPTSSVAEELFGDEESINNEIEPEAKPFSGPRSILSGFRKPRKWPSVKKAKAAPPNGNIRVEFKKASAVAAEEGSKPTFVKPDGRKPRVKANIRARKAHRGIFGQPQPETSVTGFHHSSKVTTNEEAFAEASSQLALAPPYTGDEEEDEREMEDNTEKREVSAAAGLNAVDDVDVHAKPNSQSFIHLPNLQPVILNSRQDRRSQGPPLPPDVLARIQHITDIHNLPPLPNGARPFGPGPQRSPRVKSDVLRRKQTSVAEDRIDISNEQPSLLNQLVPAVSTSSSVSSSSSTSSSFSTSSSSAPQLSAFRALVEQTEKGVSDSPV